MKELSNILVLAVFCLLAMPPVKRWLHFRRAKIIKGTIIDYRHVNTDDGRMWCPNVEYVDLDGEKKTFESGTGATFKYWKMGGKVDVAIDPTGKRPPRGLLGEF